jgi:hypothetical protein
MTQGDLRLYEPGEAIPVTLRADGAGAVAERGDPVQLVGEDAGRTLGELPAEAGAAIGALAREPEEYDPDTAYGNNEEIGTATVLAEGPVDWYEEVDGEGLAVGDLVVLTADGVRAYDSAGGDTSEMILGRVFATGTRASAMTANKIAVLRRA